MTEEQVNKAIYNRNRIKFKYGPKNVLFEPYYLSKNLKNKSVVYGRVNSSNIIDKFDIESLINATVINWQKFSPIIPLVESYN